MSKDSYVGRTLFIWIIGILITILMFIGNNVIANDQQSRQRDIEIQQCIYNYVIPMKDSIARIETKLGTHKLSTLQE